MECVYAESNIANLDIICRGMSMWYTVCGHRHIAVYSEPILFHPNSKIKR